MSEEKKTLKEEEKKALSEDQLKKVSGGFGIQTGDICPSCGKGVMSYNRNTGGYDCSVCSFTWNPNS